MSKINVTLDKNKCVFCRFWQGQPAEKAYAKDYWTIDTSALGMCMQRRLKTAAATPGCQKFERDYKYPKL